MRTDRVAVNWISDRIWMDVRLGSRPAGRRVFVGGLEAEEGERFSVFGFQLACTEN